MRTLVSQQLAAGLQAPKTNNVDDPIPPAVAQTTQVDAGHGRLETRTVKVISGFADWVPSANRWPSLSTLICVESRREELLTGKTSDETRYYVSNRHMGPTEAHQAVRSHGLVENQRHGCLDVTFGQDANQTRTSNAAENLAVVRHFALNILRHHSSHRYAVARRRRVCDDRVDYRDKLLGMDASA